MNKKKREAYLVDRKEDLRYPVYVIHSDNVELLDGIIWLDDQVLDDKYDRRHTRSSQNTESNE